VSDTVLLHQVIASIRPEVELEFIFIPIPSRRSTLDLNTQDKAILRVSNQADISKTPYLH